jgi:predicted aconitase with swiveling domain
MHMTEIELRGRALVSGPSVSAELVYTDRPLSFWGGFDPAAGRVVDRHHPLSGVLVSHRVLALPGGRGSSTASVALLEAVRVDQAPAALVVSRMDPIIALGLVVADELYGTTRTLVLLDEDDFRRLEGAVAARVEPDGTVRAIMRGTRGPA